MDTFVCGHGGWDVIQRATAFVTVPAGSEIWFYKEVGEAMTLGEAEAILRGDPAAPRPERVIRQYMQAPDMTLYACPEFESNFAAAATQGGRQAYMVTGEMMLSELLRRYPSSRLHWMACSVRELAKRR